MKKMVFAVIAGCLLSCISCAYAEEAPAAEAAVEAVTEAVAEAVQEPVAAVATESAPGAAVEAAPPVEAVPTPAAPVAAPEAVTPAAPIAETVDNLEFISGEVSALDEASKSVSVKMYGETENASDEKVLKVTVDENTDITDGEQDRDLKSLAVGTEVDVEYDPTSNKATYIFVY